MNPGIHIGPFTLYYYGMILGAAILLAYAWSRSRARLFGVAPEVIDTALLLVVPIAIIFARAYFVIFSWDLYQSEPWRMFAVWQGGLAIHGALLGGFLGLLLAWQIVRRKYKVRLPILLDIIAPTLLASQSLGRIANFVNQEAFGGPTSLPWGIYIPPEKRPSALLAFDHFHPTFAYEALWNLLGLVLLLRIEKHWRRRGLVTSGALFAFYLAWYSLGRFWIELLRTDSLMAGRLRVAQVASIIGVVGGLLYLWYRTRQWSEQSAQAGAS